MKMVINGKMYKLETALHKRCPICGTEFKPWYYCSECKIQFSSDYCDGHEEGSEQCQGLVIGDKVQDEEGNIGKLGILWNDGDFCTMENDAAHRNPKLV